MRIIINEFISNIKQNKYSFYLYTLGVLSILYSDINNIIFTYIGIGIFSIGTILWLGKLYKEYENYLLTKLMIFIITTFSAPIAYIISDLAISSVTKLQASDFSNTLLALSTILYIPILCIILSLLFILCFVIYVLIYALLRKPINHVKNILDVFHLLGVFFIYLLSISPIKLLQPEKNIIVELAYILDYKYLSPSYNLPAEQKVLLHKDNLFSTIEIDTHGRKYIKIRSLNP